MARSDQLACANLSRTNWCSCADKDQCFKNKVWWSSEKSRLFPSGIRIFCSSQKRIQLGLQVIAICIIHKWTLDYVRKRKGKVLSQETMCKSHQHVYSVFAQLYFVIWFKQQVTMKTNRYLNLCFEFLWPSSLIMPRKIATPYAYFKWSNEMDKCNQGVYREKQLRLTVHWTRTNYDDNYIAIKPLVLNSPKMQDLQERNIFKSL